MIRAADRRGNKVPRSHTSQDARAVKPLGAIGDNSEEVEGDFLGRYLVCPWLN